MSVDKKQEMALFFAFLHNLVNLNAKISNAFRNNADIEFLRIS